MSRSPETDRVGRPRRRRRGAAGRETLTEATLRADSRRYVEAKLAYSYTFFELWAVSPDRGSIAAHTAVVLGKLLEYQEAFKVMKTNDALLLLQTDLAPENRSTAETLYRKLLKKLDRFTLQGLEFRADRVVYSALVLTGRRRSSGLGG